MKDKCISVSVMCSDLMRLGDDIERLKSAGIGMLHVDVMDAHFVPNLTFGPDMIKAMRKSSELPLDIHLMVENPENLIPSLDLAPNDMITAHAELDRDLSHLASMVHEKGAKFGIALNPDTPPQELLRHKGIFDFVLLMLVYPGFAGAKLVDGILDKVPATRKWLDENGLEDKFISVDGSVSCERAYRMAREGADVFVGGTAGIYRKGMLLEDAVHEFTNAIRNE